MNTAKILVAATLVTDVLAAYLLTVATLTPDAVRNASQWLLSRLREPRSTVMRAAYGRAILGHSSNQTDQCVIEMMVMWLTALLANLIVWLIIMGASVRALLAWNHTGVSGGIIRAATIVGFFLTLSGFLVLFENRIPTSGSLLARVLRGLLRFLGQVWLALTPVIRPLYWVLSVFTQKFPLAWYSTIKLVHRRGAEWIAAVAGMLILLLGAVVKFIYLLEG